MRSLANGIQQKDEQDRSAGEWVVVMRYVSMQPGAILLCVLVCLSSIAAPAGAGEPSPLHQIQALYDQKEYRKVLEEIAKLPTEVSAGPQILRIKIRALVRIGNTKDAVAEYDKLVPMLTHDDPVILREISLGGIIALTKDMREQMRGAAYTALKDWQNSEAIPFLEEGLSDGSGLVRALAAEGLAKLGGGRRSDKFRSALEDQAVLVKEAVLKGFVKTDDMSVVLIVEPLLKDPETRVRVAAAQVLCQHKQANSCDLLLRYARAPNPDERTSAIRALVDRQAAELLPILLEASEHKQPSVRGAAAAGLAHVAPAEALPVLTRLLRDPLPPVRIAAAVSLGQLHGAETRPPLIQALNDRDSAVRAFIIGALLAQGERYDIVAGPVQSLTNMKDPAARAAVARALGHAEESARGPAKSALIQLAQDTLPRVRIAAIKSMAKIEGARAIPMLKHSLHDEDDAVRATAGGALLNVVPVSAPD